MNKKIFDRQHLSELMGGDNDIICEAVKLFKESVAESLFEIEKAIHERNSEKLKKAAHKFKGTTLNICADSVSTILAEFENITRQDQMTDAEKLFKKLNDEINALNNLLIEEDL